MENYAIYLRKSRADAEKEQYGEYETLAKHETELSTLAQACGYVCDTYKELVSGEHIADRPEFRQMMQRVSQNRYTGVLVHEVSRLGRGNAMEYGWILQTLQMSDTVIITPTKIYDPNNEDDARYLSMEMFVSNMELSSIRSRLISGERAAARAGCFIKPTPPFGYDRVRIDGKWTLTANEYAPIIKRIFERAAHGHSHGRIAKDLNADGISTKHGKQWSAARIQSILQNPHYMGKIRYGYYQHKQVPTPDGFSMRPQYSKRDDYILVDGLHEGIVSEETWEQANEPRGNSTHTPRSKEVKNPLAGLLVCAKCGRVMLRFVNTCPTNGHKIEHYRHPSFCDCHMRGARMSKIVNMVVNELSNCAEDSYFTAPQTDIAAEKKALRQSIKKEEGHIDKLLEAYFADAITADELRERRVRCDENIDKLTARLKELKTTRPPTRSSFKSAIELLKDDSISAQLKNDALKTLIERIEYTNETVDGKPHISLLIKFR